MAVSAMPTSFEPAAPDHHVRLQQAQAANRGVGP
jgi:hypothetical protein